MLEPGDVGPGGGRLFGGGAVAGARRRLLLEPGELGERVLLHLAARHRLGFTLEGRRHLAAQVAGAERLGEVADGAFDATADAVLVGGAGRQHQHGDVRQLLALGLDHVENAPAVGARHHHVENHDVRLLLAHDLQGAVAVRRGEHAVALPLQVVLDDRQDVLFVVDS